MDEFKLIELYEKSYETEDEYEDYVSSDFWKLMYGEGYVVDGFDIYSAEEWKLREEMINMIE